MSALVGCGQPTKRALRKALRGHWATMHHPTRDVPTWCLWSCPKASGHPAECRAPSRRAPSTSVTQIWQRVELQPRGGFFPQVPQRCLVHFFLQTWIHLTSDTSAPSARVQVHHLWHMELKRNWILLDWWRKEKNTIPFFDIAQSPKASKLFPHSPKLDKFRIPNLHSALRVTMMHQVGLGPNLPPRLVQLFFKLLSMIQTTCCHDLLLIAEISSSWSQFPKSYSLQLTKNGLRFHIEGVNWISCESYGACVNGTQRLAMPNSAGVLTDMDADRLTHGWKVERVSSGKCRSTPCDGAHLRHNSLSPNSRNRLLDWIAGKKMVQNMKYKNTLPVKGKLSLSLKLLTCTAKLPVFVWRKINIAAPNTQSGN